METSVAIESDHEEDEPEPVVRVAPEIAKVEVNDFWRSIHPTSARKAKMSKKYGLDS